MRHVDLVRMDVDLDLSLASWLLFTPQRLRDVFWIACPGFIHLRLFHGKLHGLGGVVVTSEFHRVGNPDFCTRSLRQVMSMSNMQPYKTQELPSPCSGCPMIRAAASQD